MKKFVPVLSTAVVRSITLLLIAIGILSTTSCKKEEETTTATSFLRIINASPTLGTFDVYINTQKANQAPLPFGGTINYVQPSAGACELKFTIANDLASLITKSVNLNVNVVYSYYLVDKGATLDGLLFVDNMNKTDATKAYVKFINLSPDAPGLSLNVLSGASLATNKTYKTSSEFVEVEAKKQSFEIKDGAGTVMTTLTDVSMVAGRYYTIIARGLLTASDNDRRFSAQSIVNQ